MSLQSRVLRPTTASVNWAFRPGFEMAEEEFNTYEPPSELASSSSEHRNSIAPYSYINGIVIYVFSCLLLWGLVAPLIAPTDVAPKGAPAVPGYLVGIQIVLCYGGPGLLVYLNWRWHRCGARNDNHRD